jgi:dTDP-4-amino-4,6-dideoxygalactose transaminase
MRSVSMLDLKAEYGLFRDEVRAAVDEVLESQHFIGGPAIARFEEQIRHRFGFRNAIAISNGTDALLCALMALGVGRDDEVIVPSFTFFATAGTVARLGAKPVFADIDPRTFNLDPARLESLITKKTRAIVPVHIFGQCADMDAINAFGKRHGLNVVEDAAQAIGAKYKGRYAGALGRVASFSFYPTKNLGGFGEGGLIVTDDDELAGIARQLRNHGESRRYHHDRVGGNFRLDTMKAAILSIKLRWLDEFTRRRRANADLYDALLLGVDVITPARSQDCEHVFHQYTVLTDDRAELMDLLRKQGIGTGIYYPLGLHRQPCFAGQSAAAALPVTESVCSRVLSLPCHPMLSPDDVQYVAAIIEEFGASAVEPAGMRGAAAS